MVLIMNDIVKYELDLGSPLSITWQTLLYLGEECLVNPTFLLLAQRREKILKSSLNSFEDTPEDGESIFVFICKTLCCLYHVLYNDYFPYCMI